MTKFIKLPSRQEMVTLVVCLALWLVVTMTFVGFRPEHPVLAMLIATMFLASEKSRKLVMALMPFAVFAVSYDWMNIVPNYEVNPVDVRGLYETEKSLFGIATASGVPGVIDVHALKTRRNGMSMIIDAHISVDPTISIVQAHDIATEVEEVLYSKYGKDTQISIHMEPAVDQQ